MLQCQTVKTPVMCTDCDGIQWSNLKITHGKLLETQWDIDKYYVFLHWTMPQMAARVFAQQIDHDYSHDFDGVFGDPCVDRILSSGKQLRHSCTSNGWFFWETSIIYQDPSAWYGCYVVSSRRMLRHPSGQFTFNF